MMIYYIHELSLDFLHRIQNYWKGNAMGLAVVLYSTELSKLRGLDSAELLTQRILRSTTEPFTAPCVVN